MNDVNEEKYVRFSRLSLPFCFVEKTGLGASFFLPFSLPFFCLLFSSAREEDGRSHFLLVVSIVKRTLSNRFFGGVPFEINSIENKVQENKNNSLLHSNWKKKKYDNWITTAFTSHTYNRTSPQKTQLID
jgi:hypothetical protein